MAPIDVAGIGAYLILAFFWLYVQRVERRRYLRYWVGAYLAFVFAEFVSMFAIYAGLDLEILVYSALATTAVLSLLGAHVYTGRRLYRGYFVAVAAALVASVALSGIAPGSGLAGVPLFVVVGGATVIAGTFVFGAGTGGTGRYVAGAGFTLLGVHSILVPILHEYPAYLSFESATNLILIVMVSVGVSWMHFESVRREAENAAAAYLSVYTNALEGLFRVDASGSFLAANQVLLQAFDQERLEQLPRLWELPNEADDRAEVQRGLQRGVLEWDRKHITCRRHDDALVHALISIRPSLIDGKIVFEGSLQDQTAERLLQRRLDQRDRLESLGRLAGGIAHDYNNILTVVLTTAEVLILEDEYEGIAEELEPLVVASQRGADLTHKLLAFSRGQDTQIRALDLVREVETTGSVLARALGEDVDFKITHAVNSLPVRTTSVDIQQILMNLCVNARNAMPHGGSLEMKLSRSKRDGSEFARLSVSDTGSGIAPEHLPNLFEPFFTTRADEGGTGLGLATVHQIVRMHGGEISVESVPGAGTTFHIELPLSETDAETVAAREIGSIVEIEATGDRPRRILLVEDDETIADLARRVLARAGYEVSVCTSPEQAIRCWKAETPDLIVSDVVMPKMSGPELITMLRATGASPPVVFMTGYPGDHLLGFDTTSCTIVNKPFSSTELLNAVSEML